MQNLGTLRLLLLFPICAAMAAVVVLSVGFLRATPTRDIDATLVASNETLLSFSTSAPEAGYLPRLAISGGSMEFAGGTESAEAWIHLEKSEEMRLADLESAFSHADHVEITRPHRRLALVSTAPFLSRTFLEPGEVVLGETRDNYLLVVLPGPGRLIVEEPLSRDDLLTTLAVDGTVLISGAALQLSEHRYDYTRGNLLPDSQGYASAGTKVQLHLAGSEDDEEPFIWRKMNGCAWLLQDLPRERPVWSGFTGESAKSWSGPIVSVKLQGYGGRISMGETEVTIQPTQALLLELSSGHLILEDAQLFIQGKAEDARLLASDEPFCGEITRNESVVPTRWAASSPLREMTIFVAGVLAGLTPIAVIGTRRLLGWRSSRGITQNVSSD